MTARTALAATLVCLAGPVRAGAQDARAHVRWQAEDARLSTDGRAEVRLSATVAPGWKMYALTSPPPAPALRVGVDTAGVRLDGAARHLRPPIAVFDSLLGVPVEQISGRADMAVPLVVTPGVAPDRVPLTVRFAVCDASICLPPRTVRVPARLLAAAPVAAARVDEPSVDVPGAPVPPASRVAPTPVLPEPAPDVSTSPAPLPPSSASVKADTTSTTADTAAVDPSRGADRPWVPRVMLGVLVAAAVVRALLFATRRRRPPQG